MARVKVTGYIDAEETPEVIDPGHPTGLTAEGYDQLTGIESYGPLAGLHVADLEDLTTEFEGD